MFEVLEVNAYEKIVFQMRSEGARKNEKGVFLGKMSGATSVNVSGLVLERDDLLFAQHLLTGYVSANGEKIEGLKKGDTVLLKRLSDEKYAVIERVI